MAPLQNVVTMITTSPRVLGIRVPQIVKTLYLKHGNPYNNALLPDGYWLSMATWRIPMTLGSLALATSKMFSSCHFFHYIQTWICAAQSGFLPWWQVTAVYFKCGEYGCNTWMEAAAMGKEHLWITSVECTLKGCDTSSAPNWCIPYLKHHKQTLKHRMALILLSVQSWCDHKWVASCHMETKVEES